MSVRPITKNTKQWKLEKGDRVCHAETRITAAACACGFHPDWDERLQRRAETQIDSRPEHTETHWAAHPAHYWIPSSVEQAEASLGSVLFINHIPVLLHVDQPQLGPPCLLVVLGRGVPLFSELLTRFPDMTALPFLPEIYWDFFILFFT